MQKTYVMYVILCFSTYSIKSFYYLLDGKIHIQTELNNIQVE